MLSWMIMKWCFTKTRVRCTEQTINLTVEPSRTSWPHSIPPLCITWHCITHPTSHNTTSRNQPFITSSRHFPTKRMTSYHIKSWHITTPPPPPPTHKRNTSQQHHHTEQVNACAHQNFCLGSALVGGPGGRPCGRAHVPLTSISKFSYIVWFIGPFSLWNFHPQLCTHNASTWNFRKISPPAPSSFSTKVIA